MNSLLSVDDHDCETFSPPRDSDHAATLHRIHDGHGPECHRSLSVWAYMSEGCSDD